MLHLPEFLLIGPLILPSSYLIFAMVAAVSSYLVYQKGKVANFPYKVWVEILLNGAMGYIIIWKFSYLLFDPKAILTNPSSILFSHGGFLGSVLGLLGGAYILYRSAKKLEQSFLSFIDLSMYWLLMSSVLYWLLIPRYGLATSLPWGISYDGSPDLYHPVHFYMAGLAWLILVYLRFKKMATGTGHYASYSLILYGLGLLLLSNVEYHSFRHFGFSPVQWLYIGMIITGLLLHNSIRHSIRRRRNETN